MKNYTNSDYALNKYSDGIVYRFADGIVEVTLKGYLAENPGKNKADFQALKEISDSDYHEEVKATYRQTWKDLHDGGDVDDSIYNADVSAENSYFNEIDAAMNDERYQVKVDLANQILGKLTEKQRTRYLQYRVEGISAREIAKLEGSNHKTVLESLEGAEKKIKKLLESS